MQEIDNLLDGYRRFRRRFYEEGVDVYRGLCANGQHPKAIVIACCDSRVDPAIVCDTAPGDLFVVRNVANLVPPCAVDVHNHGTSAALEFAVNYLEVRHVIVLGHACCGGINALMRGLSDDRPHDFVTNWMNIAGNVRKAILHEMPGATLEVQAHAAELRSIVASLNNLMTFPWVRERVEQGALAIHGWYFDMQSGELQVYNPELPGFEPLDKGA